MANGSDQVGRNYMFHNSQAVLAISREPNPTMFQKTIALNDFYFGMDGFEYPMGNIQMMGKSLGPMYRGEKPLETALLPLGLLDNLARHAVDFWLTTEDLPDPNNRVTVDASGNVTLSYTPNNQVARQKLYDKLKSMLSHLGMHPQHLIPRMRSATGTTQLPDPRAVPSDSSVPSGIPATVTVSPPELSATEMPRGSGSLVSLPVHVFARSVPRNPPQRMFVHEEGFGRGLPASRSVARETVHPIALGQAPLMDYDHQLISLATG